MSYRREIELPGLPDLQSLRHAHWRKRHAHDKQWKEAVAGLAFVNGLPKKPLALAHIECVRHSTTEPDAENLANSFKAAIDGLKGSVIVDDSPSHVSRSYAWEKAKRGEGKVRITVTEGRR